jgi:uncharacterized RDD family membrane protein YckC
MRSRKREMNFKEADCRYAELKQQHYADTLSDEEFDALLKQIMVEDTEGRWWAKARTSGEWHYHDGSTWVQSTPPYRQISPEMSEGTEGQQTAHTRLQQSQSYSEASTFTADVHVTGRRILATLIDFWMVLAIAAIISAADLSLTGNVLLSTAGGDRLMLGWLFLIYYLGCEGYLGRTMGKQLLGIKVVREGTDEVPGFASATVRTLLRPVDFLPFCYLVGFIVALSSSKRQRLGDMAARTLVIREQNAPKVLGVLLNVLMDPLGALHIINTLGMLLGVACFLGAAAVDAITGNAMLGWLIATPTIMAIDLFLRARHKSIGWTRFISPSTGGTILFSPVWLAGAIWLWYGSTLD